MKHVKKIIVGVAILGAILIFVACGKEPMQISDTGQVTKAEFLNPIKKINNANIFYSKESDYLGIELNYDSGSTNEILQEFKGNVNTIMQKDTDLFKDYQKIKEIHFTLLYKGETNLNSMEYKLENDKFVKSDESNSFATLNSYVENKPLSTSDTSNLISNDTISTDTKSSITVPENGEFKISNSDLESLKFGTIKLEYSKFKSDNGEINVDLLYSGELTKGTVLHIQQVIKNLFKDKEIELAISQKHPLNRFEFEYENGEWKEK